MSLRLVLTFAAAPGKGEEPAQALRSRRAAVAKEPGGARFGAFRSAVKGERVILLERWRDQAALDGHAAENAQRAALPQGLLAGPVARADHG